MRAHIVGAIQDICCTDAQILDVINNPISLNESGSFVGKISTELFANDLFVLKKKSAFSLTYTIAKKWCENRIALEKSYQIYPPHRTWVILEKDNMCAVANISKRGKNLATFIQENINQEQLILWLEKLLTLYFLFYKEHNLRQDEGLTNYLVEEGRLYYIDDDIYSTDNFTSLAHAIGSILRNYSDLFPPEVSTKLSNIIGEKIQETDPNLLPVFISQFNSVFFPEKLNYIRHIFQAAFLPNINSRASLSGKRLAIIADIHANLAALKAVIMDIQAEEINEILVLGDIVGYGPHPKECIALIQQHNMIVIRGNHDNAMCHNPSSRFNRAALWSIEWTRTVLNEKEKDWLGNLPLYLDNDDIYAVHGAPIDASFFNAYVYPATAESNLDVMQTRNMHLCFHGHSHTQGVYIRNKQGIDSHIKMPTTLTLTPGSFYLICPGSVGQPRDDFDGAEYCIFDKENNNVLFKKLDYDKIELIAAMDALSFPNTVKKLFD